MKYIGVIGGGIAGLGLSIDLAKRGFKATVFEKNRYPNHKVCGEYVSAEASPYLNYLGVLIKMSDCPRINQLEVSSPKGRIFKTKMKMGGIGISRYAFDDLLYKRALELKVDFVFEEVADANETEISTKADKTFQFDRVIGSFGKRSNLDLKWNRAFAMKSKNSLNQWVGIKYHIDYDGIDDKTIALHNFDHGYCGISKVEKGRACLCYLVSSKVMKNKTIPELEAEVLKRNPHLKTIFEKSSSLYDKPLAISQISFDKKTLKQSNVSFIGDAAGLITPLCGNGMSLALRSAKMMAESIRDDSLEYEVHWKKVIAPRLWWGRQIQRGFGNVRLSEVLVAICRLFPFLGKFLVSKSHGDEF